MKIHLFSFRGFFCFVLLTSCSLYYENIDDYFAYAQEKTQEIKLVRINTDKDQYEKKIRQTTIVQISGEIIGHIRGVPILLQITDPKGTITELVVKVSKNGIFNLPYLLSDNSPSGNYNIMPIYHNEELNDINFKFFQSFENNKAPIPKIDIRVEGPYFVGKSIIFSAVNSYDLDGEIEEYIWNFDDGVIASNSLVPHAYLKNATYTITLTVYDDLGLNATTTKKIIVEPNLFDFSISLEENVYKLSIGGKGQSMIFIFLNENNVKENEITLNCKVKNNNEKIKCNISPSNLKIRENTISNATITFQTDPEIEEGDYQLEVIAMNKYFDITKTVPFQVLVKPMIEITNENKFTNIESSQNISETKVEIKNFVITHENSSESLKLFIEKTGESSKIQGNILIHSFDEPGEFLITIYKNEKYDDKQSILLENQMLKNEDIVGINDYPDSSQINEIEQWNPITISVFIILPVSVSIIIIIVIIKKLKFQPKIMSN